MQTERQQAPPRQDNSNSIQNILHCHVCMYSTVVAMSRLQTNIPPPASLDQCNTRICQAQLFMWVCLHYRAWGCFC